MPGAGIRVSPAVVGAAKSVVAIGSLVCQWLVGRGSTAHGSMSVLICLARPWAIGTIPSSTRRSSVVASGATSDHGPRQRCQQPHRLRKVVGAHVGHRPGDVDLAQRQGAEVDGAGLSVESDGHHSATSLHEIEGGPHAWFASTHLVHNSRSEPRGPERALPVPRPGRAARCALLRALRLSPAVRPGGRRP